MIAFAGWAGRLVCVCVSVDSLDVCVKSATRCFIYLFCGSVTLSGHIKASSLHRKKKHTRGNNTIPYKLATLVTFETLKWKHTFATIVTRDESPLVYRAPESASEHSHFGTFHIGTSTIRDCTTALFQLTMPTCSSHGNSVQAPIRL